jgi:hypothetical protein
MDDLFHFHEGSDSGLRDDHNDRSVFERNGNWKLEIVVIEVEFYEESLADFDAEMDLFENSPWFEFEFLDKARRTPGSVQFLSNLLVIQSALLQFRCPFSASYRETFHFFDRCSSLGNATSDPTFQWIRIVIEVSRGCSTHKQFEFHYHLRQMIKSIFARLLWPRLRWRRFLFRSGFLG